MRKKLALFLCIIFLLNGCGGKNKDKDKESKDSINLCCDAALSPLMEAIIKESSINGEIKISVDYASIKASEEKLKDGQCDGIMTIEKLTKQDLTEKELAIDGVIIIVNKDNDIKNISIPELQKIYTGTINNWSGLKGKDIKILPLSYNEDSSLEKLFSDKVITTNKKDVSVKLPDPLSVIETVSKERGAIGFIPRILSEDIVKVLKLNETEASDTAIQSEIYPLKIKVNLYSKKKDKKAEKLSTYLKSDEGKKIIKKYCVEIK